MAALTKKDINTIHNPSLSTCLLSNNLSYELNLYILFISHSESAFYANDSFSRSLYLPFFFLSVLIKLILLKNV